MTVLYLHRTQGFGVERVHIEGIRNALVRRGFRVQMIGPGDASGLSDGVERKEARELSRLYGLVSKYCPEIAFEILEMLYNVPALVRTIAASQSGKVTFLYERYAFFAIAGALCARFRRLPLVLEVNYTTRTSLVRKRTRLFERLARTAEKFILGQAAAVVVVSSFLKMQLINDMDVDAGRIIVSPNAVDPVCFDHTIRAATNLNGLDIREKQIIGFVGGFYSWHGLDLLLEAFSLVAADFPECVLILIGDGPEYENIRALAGSLGLREKVLFTKRVPHRELPPLVKAFTIGVMPDSNEYGSPMKVFEYMAMARAVVAPDYPPLMDVLRDGDNGLLFQRRNAKSMADALRKLLVDERLRNAIGESARASVEVIHNWDHSAGDVLRLLSRQGYGETPQEPGPRG